jgi:hypothetical protein
LKAFIHRKKKTPKKAKAGVAKAGVAHGLAPNEREPQESEAQGVVDLTRSKSKSVVEARPEDLELTLLAVPKVLQPQLAVVPEERGAAASLAVVSSAVSSTAVALPLVASTVAASSASASSAVASPTAVSREEGSRKDDVEWADWALSWLNTEMCEKRFESVWGWVSQQSTYTLDILFNHQASVGSCSGTTGLRSVLQCKHDVRDGKVVSSGIDIVDLWEIKTVSAIRFIFISAKYIYIISV